MEVEDVEELEELLEEGGMQAGDLTAQLPSPLIGQQTA